MAVKLRDGQRGCELVSLSAQLKGNGFSPDGKQKYLGKECGRASRENVSAKGSSEARKAEILRAYQERSSLRGLRRTFGVSRTTVTKWLKKSQVAERTRTLLVPEMPERVVLELDEMWSLCGSCLHLFLHLFLHRYTLERVLSIR